MAPAVIRSSPKVQTAFGSWKIDGGQFGGVAFFYGARGSVERSFVTNTQSGIVFEFDARGLVGETLITDMSFLGVNVLENSHAIIEDTRIDNSMNVGSGVAIQLNSSRAVRNVTAIGAGMPTAFGPQFGFFFGYRNPNVEAVRNTAIHNQTGFGAYCVTSIPSADELTDEHNRASGSTVKDFDVLTTGCAPPPPGL